MLEGLPPFPNIVPSPKECTVFTQQALIEFKEERGNLSQPIKKGTTITRWLSS